MPIAVSFHHLKHRLNKLYHFSDEQEPKEERALDSLFGPEGAEVEQPPTPSRDDLSARWRQQGLRLGTRQEVGTANQDYEDLYEEANSLLKDLHFERLLRISVTD